ncbi:MAG: hypothetical protein WDW38_007661 [Sanguina aurantia]
MMAPAQSKSGDNKKADSSSTDSTDSKDAASEARKEARGAVKYTTAAVEDKKQELKESVDTKDASAAAAKQASDNNRANQMNSNSAGYQEPKPCNTDTSKAAMDNRSNQMNPNQGKK